MSSVRRTLVPVQSHRRTNRPPLLVRRSSDGATVRRHRRTQNQDLVSVGPSTQGGGEGSATKVRQTLRTLVPSVLRTGRVSSGNTRPARADHRSGRRGPASTWTSAGSPRSRRRWTGRARGPCCGRPGTRARPCHEPGSRNGRCTRGSRIRRAACPHYTEARGRGPVRRSAGRILLRAAVGRPRPVCRESAPVPAALYTRSDVCTDEVPARRQPAPPQHRHHRPRRPRQDHAGRRPAPPERHLPRQRARGRARHGQQRPRARARHHHPGQEHRRPLPATSTSTSSTRPATPTSAARSSARCRWSTACCCWWTRRRGRCRRRASCCARRSSAACRRSSSSTRSTGPTRAPQEVLERGLRPVHRPRRHRGPARLPGALHQRASGHGHHRSGRRPATDLRPLFDAIVDARAAAARRRRTRRCRCSSPTSTRATTSGASRSAASSTGACRSATRSRSASSTARHQETKVTKLFAFDGLQARRHRGGRRRRHRLPGRHRGHHHRRDHRRPRAPPGRCRRIAIDEPTVSMIFGVNTSPLAGPRGAVRHVAATCASGSSGSCSATSRMRVEDTDSPEQMKVVGRGELQLSILIEMMRREGFELQVSRPEIVTQGGRRRARSSRSRTWSSTCPRSTRASSSRRSGTRRGVDDQDGEPRQRPRAPRVPHPDARADRLPLAVPHRHARHRHHEPPLRRLGAVARPDPGARDRRAGRRPHRRRHRLRDLQPAGARRDLHRAGDRGLRGHDRRRELRAPTTSTSTSPRRRSRPTCARRRPTRRSASIPPRKLGLEQAIEFINDDELVEVTPKRIRLRKRVLQANQRPRRED